MKHISYGWMIAGYIAMVLFSFLFLTAFGPELAEKHPQLMDKGWKRVLWLLSCLLFIPYIVIMAGFPSFLIGELRKFLSTGKGKKN